MGVYIIQVFNVQEKASKDKSYVSKLQELNYTSKNEIEIGKLIQEIPDFQNFFLPVLSFLWHQSFSY